MDPFAEELAQAIEAALPTWVERCVALRVARTDLATSLELREAAVRAGQLALAEIGPHIRSLLESDIDAQWTTPLALLRKAVLYPTRVLKEAGIPDVERDPFRVQIFPQDIYDLTPANFGAIDQSLSDPGVAWGASKAMTHIRRHRQ